MKASLVLALLVAFLGLSTARRNTVLEFEAEDHSREVVGHPGVSVEGSYSWTSPEGMKYTVEYIADELGYRITSTNAVPMTQAGVKADGNQGSFNALEE
ncbi:cuticle protein 16.8-like [Penaeus japonicus]|uniref:cuticle protein 16.8-like n=1 Tax=Penaeus japonicus TaxID=27405 RepID=UPI001C7161C6|nr:cuticle protein 16.8-like [Penaeus japonicus]